MDAKHRQSGPVGDTATMLLMVCTRCLSLRKEELGKTAAICECGGRRRIFRFLSNP